MAQKLLPGALIAALLFGLILIVLIVIVGVGTFAVPSMVLEWKAQGLNEAPIFWQILIDISDLAKANWYIVFPTLLIVTVLASYTAIHKNRQSAS